LEHGSRRAAARAILRVATFNTLTRTHPILEVE
jgi:hypothetical protein